MWLVLHNCAFALSYIEGGHRIFYLRLYDYITSSCRGHIRRVAAIKYVTCGIWWTLRTLQICVRANIYPWTLRWPASHRGTIRKVRVAYMLLGRWSREEISWYELKEAIFSPLRIWTVLLSFVFSPRRVGLCLPQR